MTSTSQCNVVCLHFPYNNHRCALKTNGPSHRHRHRHPRGRWVSTRHDDFMFRSPPSPAFPSPSECGFLYYEDQVFFPLTRKTNSRVIVFAATTAVLSRTPSSSNENGTAVKREKSGAEREVRLVSQVLIKWRRRRGLVLHGNKIQ